MNYELAQKLKDKGFPQEPFWGNHGETVYYGGSWYIIPLEEACPQIVFAGGDDYKKGLERGDNLIKMPSLSELINAIHKWRPKSGMNGMIFNLEGHWMHDFGYQAKLYVVLSIEPLEEKEYKHWAQTPEEAVAELWLLLSQ